MNKQRISNGCMFSMTKRREAPREEPAGAGGRWHSPWEGFVHSDGVQAVGAPCWVGKEQLLNGSPISHPKISSATNPPATAPMGMGKAGDMGNARVHANTAPGPWWHLAPICIRTEAALSAPQITPPCFLPAQKALSRPHSQASRFHVEPSAFKLCLSSEVLIEKMCCASRKPKSSLGGKCW